MIENKNTRVVRGKIFTVVIRGGEQVRSFKNLRLLCTLFHLDHTTVSKFIRNKGYWIGLEFTIFSSIIETPSSHRGPY